MEIIERSPRPRDLARWWWIESQSWSSRRGRSGQSNCGRPALDSMLRTEAFLQCFRKVDIITGIPRFLHDFSLTKPGFNDGGEGHRFFYTGESPQTISGSTETIEAFWT